MQKLFESKTECFGCESCVFACPAGAISAHPDDGGFLYPLVDEDLCVECGRCLEICPAKNKLSSAEPEVFCLRCNDSELLFNSTSGGAFSLISSCILEEGGLVCGAIFDDEFHVKHVLSDDIAKMRKSKYIQSSLSECFAPIKKALDLNKTVLFTGTPCQCHAIKLLFPENDNLILAALICRGVLSPKLWASYKNFLEQDGTMSSFCFRDKREDNDAHTVAYTIDGTEKTSLFMKDPFCRIYSKEIALRPSCYSCPYSCFEKDFDFTIGDFWGVDKVYPDLADGKGVSLILLNGEKAREIFAKLFIRADIREVSKEQAMQPALREPPNVTMLRKFFIKDLEKNGSNGLCDIEMILKKYGF